MNDLRVKVANWKTKIDQYDLMKREFLKVQSDYKNQLKYMNKLKTEKVVLEKELD